MVRHRRVMNYCIEINSCVCICSFAADDDSDAHDFDGAGSDVEYGGADHRNIGQHSFSQMQVCAVAKSLYTHSGDEMWWSLALTISIFVCLFDTGWLGSSTFAWQSTTYSSVWSRRHWWQQRRSRASRTVRKYEYIFLMWHWNLKSP